MDCIAHQAPLSMEFSRQKYQDGEPFPTPGDLPDPGLELGSPALQAGFFFFFFFYHLSYQEATQGKVTAKCPSPQWLLGGVSPSTFLISNLSSFPYHQHILYFQCCHLLWAPDAHRQLPWETGPASSKVPK